MRSAAAYFVIPQRQRRPPAREYRMSWQNVVFDFDGVIAVNSQQVAFEVFTEELRTVGIEISVDDMFERFLGWRGEAILGDLQNEHAVRIDPLIVTRVRERSHHRLLTEVRADSSLSKLVGRSDKRFICTVNQPHYVTRLLERLQLADWFPPNAVFTAGPAWRPKPHPDIYLGCLTANGLDSSQSCAIEDSVAGVRAAHAAGLYTYGFVAGVPDHVRPLYRRLLLAAGADEIINSFNEVGR
jgi:beta-phosphoglucomutase-like phosphatase (HAD superfamily)